MTNLKFAIGLLLALLLPLSAFAQVQEQLDEFFKAQAAEGFNGNFLYSRNDSIIFIGNYGYANFETKMLLNDSTVFELASCSKQFTALAIVQLVEQEKLNYDTQLDEIIRDFPYKGISVEHLLRHQSGLPDYMKLWKKVGDKKGFATNESIIQAFIEHQPKIDFLPGEKYEYSNTGYLLLASIIEKVSGMSLGDYMEKYIFQPARMQNSCVYRRYYQVEDIPNSTIDYSYRKRKKDNRRIADLKKYKEVIYLDGIVGDGMVNSTLLDLEKWKYALRNNLLISEASKAKMFSPDELSTDYGYGLVIQESKSLGKIIFHIGGWGGYRTMTLYIPASNEYFVILCNNGNIDALNKIGEIVSITQ